MAWVVLMQVTKHLREAHQMSEIGRRDALGVLAGAAASGLVGCGDGEELHEAAENLGELTQALLPALSLPGTYAYAEKTLRAGDTINFRISSDTGYQLSIVRLGWDTTGPTKDTVIATFPASNAAVQPIRKGSYARVLQGLPQTFFPEMSLECWVRVSSMQAEDFSGNSVPLPSTANRMRGLICQYSLPSACGVGLFIDDSGKPAMYWGDGGTYNPEWLKSSTVAITDGNWHHLATTFKNGTAKLFVDGVLRASFIRPAVVNPGAGPLHLAAFGGSVTSGTLDGDLAMPAIYSRALTDVAVGGAPGEVQTRSTTKPPIVPGAAGLLACWPLTEERGTTLADVSSSARTASIVNQGTWMIGGPGYSSPSRASTVVGTGGYSPMTDSTRGHGLRFSSEDLYDCGWLISASYTLPRDLLPGIYVGRIMYGPSLSLRYDTTFVVRPAATKPRARVLVLCNTNTWLAYTVPFPSYPWAIDGWGTGGAQISTVNAPAFNMYSTHEHREVDQSNNSIRVGTRKPTFQVGVNMPWAAFPYGTYIGTSYAHLVRAERPFHVWLEQMGYDYDVAGDLDLDADPNLLAGYKIVAIVGHSEYWSTPAYAALEGYLNAGGRLVVLSGNTMFWRVSFDSARRIMECRKCPGLVGGQTEDYGLTYHSHDFWRGGLMREAGFPAWRLTGLDSVGYDGAPAGNYQVRTPSHAFFQGPEPISVLLNHWFAMGAVQHEYDVTLAKIPGASNITPLPGSAPVALLDAPAFSDNPPFEGGLCFNYAAAQVTPAAGAVASEVIDWQRGPGGRVFSAGAIAVADKLKNDAPLAALVRNVMHHFGVAHRRDFFVRTTDGKIRVKRWSGSAWLPTPTGWDDLGGALVTSPTATQVAPNRIAIMGLDSVGTLRYREWDGAAWQTWTTRAGATLVGRVSAVGWARDRVNIFGRGSNGHIFCLYRDGSNWSNWQDMGGTMSGPPATALYNGNPVMAAIGTNGHLMYRWSDGTNWFPGSGWLDMGGASFTGTPVLTTWGGNRLSIFALDTNGHLFTKEWDGANWLPSVTQWTLLGSAVTSTPSVAVRSGNKLTLVALGRDGEMLAKSRHGLTAAWDAGWSFIGGGFIGAPSAIGWRGELVSVTAVTAQNHLHHCMWDGSTWGGWVNLTGDLGGGINATPGSLAWFGS
jgi:hypothetical protein